MFADPILKTPKPKIPNKGRGVSTSMSNEEARALAEAFDGPSGPQPWAYVTAWKFRVYDGHYVVCRIEPPGKTPFYADLARGSKHKPYEFQNDSLEMTDWQWERLSIPEECDWFEVPEEKESAT